VKGYDSRGKNYTGLLEKCPALSFTDRTVTVTETDGYAVRRRTEAFEWDRELYRQWNGGGACWLDRDPKDGDGGSFAELLHVSCNGTDIDNNSVLREGDLLQNRNYTATQQAGPDTSHSLHNSPCAANENRSLPKSAGTENIVPEQSPIDCCTCSKPAANMQQTNAPAGKQNRTVKACDYKKLEPPEPKTVCYTCGKKGSWFIEKFTKKERRARPKDQQDARRVCRSCYTEAVKAEQMASVPLTGTVDVSRCSRVTADVGKCSVWIDREAGVKLCEHCYGGGLRESVREAGVV
jgi:hypothetical protein